MSPTSHSHAHGQVSMAIAMFGYSNNGARLGQLNPRAAEFKMPQIARPAKAELTTRPSLLRATAPEFQASEDRSNIAWKIFQLFKDADLRQRLLQISIAPRVRRRFPKKANIFNQSLEPEELGLEVCSLSKSIPAVEFHLFGHLPTELRFKIWKCILPGPRVIDLHYNKFMQRSLSATPPPVSLHICHESREEALRTLTLLFEDCVLNPPVYIDPEIDTLYLSDEREEEYGLARGRTPPLFYDAYFHVMFRNIRRLHISSLKHLAMSIATWDKIEYEQEANGDLTTKMYALTEFQNLDTLTIIYEDITASPRAGTTLSDIPYLGCTHVRKSGSQANLHYVDPSTPCSSCMSYVRMVTKQKRDYPEEIDAVRLEFGQDLRRNARMKKGWKFPEIQVKFLVPDEKWGSGLPWNGLPWNETFEFPRYFDIEAYLKAQGAQGAS